MARKPKDWTPEDLARQGEAAAMMIEYLKAVHEDDDPDLVEDVIEGETDFKEVLARADDQIAEAEMMAAAIKDRETALAQRRKRFEDRATFLRHCVTMAMIQANGDQAERPLPFTITLPTATFTVKDGKPKVIIEDESKLPAEFWRVPEPVIDRAKLNERVKAALDFIKNGPLMEDDDSDADSGPTIPEGVTLSDPGFTLTVRRK